MSGKIAILKEKALSSGKSFETLKTVLFDVCGISDRNVEMFNIPPDINAIKAFEPDVIIGVGEPVLTYCTQLKGITKHAGKVLDMPGGFKLVPIVSPGFLEHNPNYMRTMAEHVQVAHNLSLGIEVKPASNTFKIVESYEEIEQVVEYCRQSGYCSPDFETTELNDLGTFSPDFHVTTLSISFQIGSSYVIPLEHAESKFDIYKVAEIIAPIFADPNITKVGQNIKFDMHCLAYMGIRVFRGPFHDLMLLHQLYDENLPHGLKPIVRDLFPQFANYEDELGKNWNAPLKVLAPYNALDSDLTLRGYWYYTDYFLIHSPEIYLMYRNLTAPATKTLFFMEERGMLVDKRHLVEAIRKVDEMIEKQEKAMRDHYEVTRFELSKKNEARENYIKELEEKIVKLGSAEFKSKAAQVNQQEKLTKLREEITALKAGTKDIEAPQVNFGSPLQLKDLLFTKEGFGFVIPKQDFRKLPEDSTNSDNITLIKDKTGFIEELLAYRQLKLIRSTYLVGILEKLDSDHYIHTSFFQHVTITGRLSSRKPNLQNIITRTKFKIVEDAVALVKQAFIPPQGYTLVQADYSQIELRVIAHYSGEKNMLQIYRKDEDIHEATAANSHGYSIEDFRALKESDPTLYKKLRFQAKAENFGYCYGQSAAGFKEYARTDYNMDITLKDAERRREAYFKKYPGLLNYHRLYVEKARKFKYVRTFFGRKVHLPDIDSINGGKKGHAERNAINSPIQGTAGEMTVFALGLLENKLPKGVAMVNTIHDSIMFYIKDEKVEEALPIIQETMEHPPLMEYFGKTIDSVPLKVEFEGSKESWGKLK